MIKKRNKLNIILWICILLLTVIIYNISGIFYEYEVSHPSETEAMYFSDSVIENESYTLWLYTDLEKEKYEIGWFWAYDSENNKFLPKVAWWIIYVSTYFKLIWIPPIVWISIINILWLVFIYLLIKLRFNQQIAIITSVLFWLNTYVILWNNFLYANLTWIIFFIIALYYFSKEYKIKNILLWIFFLYIFFLFRFEAVIYGSFWLIYMIIIHYKKVFKWKHFLVYIIFWLSLICLFLVSNQKIYNDPIHVWYTKSDKAKNKQTEEILQKWNLAVILNKYQFFRTRFIKNQWWIKEASSFAYWQAYRFIIEPLNLVFLLWFLWLFLLLTWKTNRETKAFIIIFSLLWFYFSFFETFSYHYWWNRSGITSFYSRYFFFVYFIIILLFSYYVFSRNYLNNNLKIILVCAMIIVNLDNVFFRYNDSLINQALTKNTYHNIKAELDKNEFQPQDTVVISWLFSKILYNYNVVNPFSLFDLENNSMFSTIDKSWFDACKLSEQIEKNYKNKKIISVEFKKHRSHLNLWWKLEWTEIWSNHNFNIHELDIKKVLNTCKYNWIENE